MDSSLHSICSSIAEENSDGTEIMEHIWPRSTVESHHISAWNEMLHSENSGALTDRVDDLERRVQSQEDELMCLRSSTAEVLRRLNGLEQSLFSGSGSTTTTTTNPTAATPLHHPLMSASPAGSRSSRISDGIPSRTNTSTSGQKQQQHRQISQSTYNLHILPTKNHLNNGYLTPSAAENHERAENMEEVGSPPVQTFPRPRRYLRRNVDKIGQQGHEASSDQQKSMTTPSIRKWMSSADVKFAGRHGSTDHLNCANKNRQAAPSVTNLSRFKSASKLGSTNSLSASQRSLSRFGLELREPTFLQEKGMLQVFVNGKATFLPAPSEVAGLDPLRELDAPTCHPSLDWVYGYRGKDCRGNLHELPTGEIVYFTGTVVVLHNAAEGMQRYYTKHTSDIKCIAVHPNRLHIATGQTSRRFLEKNSLNVYRSPISSLSELNSILETDQYQAHVRIWDSVTLQTLRTVGMGDANANFDRGVQCCAFGRAAGGGLLAVVDDSYEHVLSIWEWQSGKKLAEVKSANDQVFACEFHPHSNNIVVSYGKGHYNVWTMEGSTLTKKPIVFEGRNKPKLVLCSCFTERGHIITGDSNGTLTLWDSKQVKMIKQVAKAHDGGVWALCLLSNGHFVSAGKDRTLVEWETNGLTKVRGPATVFDEKGGFIRAIAATSGSFLLIGTTKNAIWKGTMDTGFYRVQQGHSDGVTQICAHPTKRQFLSSSADSTLRLCDLETKTVLWSLHAQEGICCVDFHPQGNAFVVGLADGSWAVYDFTTRGQLYSGKEGEEAVSSIRFSATGNFLAIATKEKNLLIYAVSGDLRYYVKAAEITELNAFITTVDWSTDGTLLRANDDNFQHYIWNSSNGQPAEITEVRDADWASTRCLVSFENVCILHNSKGMIATVDRSPDKQCVAVGFSNGLLRFYRYPATTIMAAYKEVFGYSTCTRNVTFVGPLLISDGAKDGTIYQWKL